MTYVEPWSSPASSSSSAWPSRSRSKQRIKKGDNIPALLGHIARRSVALLVLGIILAQRLPRKSGSHARRRPLRLGTHRAPRRHVSSGSSIRRPKDKFPLQSLIADYAFSVFAILIALAAIFRHKQPRWLHRLALLRLSGDPRPHRLHLLRRLAALSRHTPMALGTRGLVRRLHGL